MPRDYSFAEIHRDHVEAEASRKTRQSERYMQIDSALSALQEHNVFTKKNPQHQSNGIADQLRESDESKHCCVIL